MFELVNKIRSKGFSRSFVIVASTQLLGMAFGYIVSIQLAQQLSSEGFGVWSFLFQSVIPISLVIVLFGSPVFLVREVTKTLAMGDLKGSWKMVKTSSVLSLAMLLLLSVLFFSFRSYLFKNSGLTNSGIVAIVLLIALLVFGRLRQSYQQIIGQSGISQIPERIVAPILFIGLLLFAVNGRLDINNAIELYAAAVLVAILIGLITLKPLVAKSTSNKVDSELKGEKKTRKYFFLLSVVDIIDTNIDLILLNQFTGYEEIAYFSVAKRISFLLNLILFSTNYTLFPIASSLYSEGKTDVLQKQLFRIVKVNSLVGTIGVVVLFTLKNWILGFFGSEYVTSISYTLYAILLLSQWLNIVFGLPGLLLNISSNERYSLVVFALAIVFQIVLSVIFLPKFGIVAMAVIQLLNTVFWNVTLGIIAKRKIGLRATFWY